ncbi:MAG TPA: marine proteobacterial sortase target protein [Allosphingosinicella sp.]
MRSSIFNRYDRELIYYRTGPARRTAIGLSILFLLSLAAFAAFSAARAGEGQDEGGQIAAGTLVLHPRGGGGDLPAVRLGTHFEVHVSGAIARTRVVQAFRNTGNQWASATYLYPLPEDGAVDGLKMVVGQRVIVGEIRRRAEAAEIYREAEAQGQRAALVEEQRPNMFTNRVANIGPGETVLIEIEYQAPVAVRSGQYSLRLPLVVGPRYVPPHTLAGEAAVADADAVVAPMLNPRRSAPMNPVSIEVHLQPGFPIANLDSPYHRIAAEPQPGGGRIVRLADGETPANRDFELRWRSASADANIGLFRERVANQDYLMAMVTPPVDDRRRAVPPREMIFVIDNSGSMAGESMDQAKASLLHALGTLTPADRFNVIRFDDTMTLLFNAPVQATPDQVAVAERFTRALESNGGTEMLPALRAALVDPTPADARVRQLIFMTDGEISNEAEMMEALGRSRGRSRVFMIGIGSAPNNYLMGRMAEVGRGTYTHIGGTGEVNARMTELLDRLTRPAVTDLRVRLTGSRAEITPELLPDLYAGEPLVLLARGYNLQGTLEVSGRIGGREWTRSVPLGEAVAGPGVAKLWARRRIAEIEVAATLGTMEDQAAADAIARLGLDFSLVSRETSLVAVDRTPARPRGTRLTREEIPLNLPHGWDFDTLFNGNSADMSRAASPEEATQQFDLPAGGTDAWVMMRSGLVLLILALAGLLALRRRKPACA